MVDNFSVTSDGRESRNEYDFLGYNVYVDGVVNNTNIFDSTSYNVYRLDNEVLYTFGVSSVYEGAQGESNYESDPINILAQSIYVFGDVTGTISDPNGTYLDSVIVIKSERDKVRKREREKERKREREKERKRDREIER